MATRAACPCLIDGRWTNARVEQTQPVWNPSTGEEIAATPMCGPADVDLAVQAAARAYPAWAETPAVERARLMFRLRELLLQHAEDLASLITREHGKTLGESRGSIQRGIEMVEFACGLPALLTGDTIENIAAGVDCETVRHPLGVVAGITPFNFPAMVPMWMFPTALVCGNCFILKPSERVPLSAVRLGELMLEAGAPPGVFSIVHGGRECVDAILTHPGIRAVSFVGSTSVARHVYSVGAAHGKRVQANGGAKNHVIVMPDADMDVVVEGLKHAAFGCAGERCMAGSLAVPVGAAADELVARLCDAASRMTVGRTDTGAPVDMGPVITRQHLERVRNYVHLAERQKAEVPLDGRAVRVVDAPGGFFIGPTIVDRVAPDSPLVRDEIFGPLLTVTRVASLEDALALGRQCEFGNGAVIFTRSGRAARQFKHAFNAGMIGINVGVPAPMAWFPFTGWNQSFFGDLHIQGKEGMHFHTQQRMTMTRWPAETGPAEPGWKPH